MAEIKGRGQSTGTDSDHSAQYVTFIIGEETYGVEVLKVHEIIGMTKITCIPNTMHFMKGMINLREFVVPVVDMRLKFGMQEKEYDNNTVILIVELKDKLVGMIVDSVSEVIELPIKSIQETPQFSTSIETNYIEGIGKREEELIIILDVDRILSSEELDEISQKETA